MTGRGDADDPMVEQESSKRGLTIFVVVAALVALAIAAVLAIESWQSSDDDDNLVSIDTTLPSSTSAGSQPTSVPDTTVPATTEPAPATTAPASTVAPDTTAPVPATTVPAVTTVPPTDLTRDAVWPLADSDVTYDDPVDAARGFAVDYVGFAAPEVGDFQAADGRSGEVEVRAGETGPVTVVTVRQLADDGTWWVTGSQTDNIVVESPEPLDTVQSPMTVSGQARAFEGTVNLELARRRRRRPVGRGLRHRQRRTRSGTVRGDVRVRQPG